MDTQMPIDLPIPTSRRTVLRLIPAAMAYPGLPAFGQKATPGDRSTPNLTLDLKRIENALSGMVADGRAAGVSALIWKDDREAYFGSAGFADREAGRPMKRDTI